VAAAPDTVRKLTAGGAIIVSSRPQELAVAPAQPNANVQYQ
jgi:hypothetical protein